MDESNEDYDIRVERNPHIIRVTIKKNILKKLIFTIFLFFLFFLFLVSIFFETLEYHLNSIFYVFLGNILCLNLIQ